jgi:hypothetical protein
MTVTIGRRELLAAFGHRASGAKDSDENQVAANQRKAKTDTCEQGKSDQLPKAWRHILHGLVMAFQGGDLPCRYPQMA